MKSPNKEEVEDLVYDLLNIFVKFDDEKKPKLNTLQKYSEENEKLLSDFIQKYRSRLPELNALNAFLQKLDKDCFFLFLPNLNLDQIELLRLNDYLKTISAGKKYIRPLNYKHHYYGDLLKIYTLHFIGSKRVSIGEKDKNKRICRFCNRDNEKATFNNRAHAISEALGNKTVILYDECDYCNKKFSEETESDIITYLSIFRTIYGVKGKRGIKKIKGKNFKLFNEGTGNIKIENITDNPRIDDKNYKITLRFGEAMISQNIYKCLCKYFLSVINKKHLSHFKNTIDWINGNIKVDQLPKIAEITTYESFAPQPQLVYYLRKDEFNNLPYAVGEFRFTCKVLVFIVPFSSADSCTFLNKKDYQNFWKTFKHFKKLGNWTYNDFSNSSPRDFTLDLDFQVNEDQKKI